MPPVRKMGNPNWHKGMAKVPGSGSKKDTPKEIRPSVKLSRELLVLATDLIGQDGKGKGQTLGWLQQVWKEHPIQFIEMWRDAMPVQLVGPNEGPLEIHHVVSSPEDAKLLLEAEGVTVEGALLEIAAPAAPTEPDPDPVAPTNGKGNGQDHD